MGIEHAAILRKAGWTDAEVLRVRYRETPIDRIAQFLRNVNRHQDAQQRQVTLDAFIDGYICGVYARVEE